MRKFLRTKSSILVASIFALGATVITGCDNSSETKAVDRVEEAAALARVKDLEARADTLKGNMPAANDITAGSADAASGKPSIKMPDESTIPDDEYGAAVRRDL
jgi:thiosulfate dehydrogenase